MSEKPTKNRDKVWPPDGVRDLKPEDKPGKASPIGFNTPRIRGVQPPCRDIFDILNVATARKQGLIEVTGQEDGRLNYALTPKGEQEREKGQDD